MLTDVQQILLISLIHEIERIELLISSWDSNSETSSINQNAGIKPVKVSKELWDLIDRSLISIRLNYNLEKEKSKKIFNEKIIVQNDLNHKKVELLNKSNFIAC